MEQGETRYINNQLYYYNVSDSKWYPVPMRVVGGGGRRVVAEEKAVAQITTNADYIFITSGFLVLESIADNENITLASNEITVLKTGKYEINWRVQTEFFEPPIEP